MHILVANVGSSSLKLELWDTDGSRCLDRLEAREIDTPACSLWANGRQLAKLILGDHVAALTELLARFPQPLNPKRLGHRLVHGGTEFRHTAWIDARMMDVLQNLIYLNPLHLPPTLAVIRSCREQFAGIPQAAIFDTAFHTDLPPCAFHVRFQRIGAPLECGVTVFTV